MATSIDQHVWPLSARRHLAWSNMDTLVFLPSEVSQLSSVYRKELARVDVDRPMTTNMLQIRVVDHYAWLSSSSLLQSSPKRQLACMVEEVRQVHKQHDVVFARWAEHGKALFTADNVQQGVLWQCTNYLNHWKPIYKIRFSSPLLAHTWLHTERQYTGTFEQGVLKRLHRLSWMGPRNPLGGYAFMTLSIAGQISLYYQETRDIYKELHGQLDSSNSTNSISCEYLAGDICLWSDGKALVTVIYHQLGQLHQSLYEISVQFDGASELTSRVIWTTTIDVNQLDPSLLDSTSPLVYWTRLSPQRLNGNNNTVSILTLVSPIDTISETSHVMIWQINGTQLVNNSIFSLPHTLITNCDVDPKGNWWCIGTVDGRLEIRPFNTTANTRPINPLLIDQSIVTTGTILDLCFSPNGCAIAFTRDTGNASGNVELASFTTHTSESNTTFTQYITNQLCMAIANGISTSDIVHQFEKYSPTDQLTDNLQNIFTQSQLILSTSFPLNTSLQDRLFLSVQQSLLRVCALDKIKRTNIQLISQYWAVFTKWDICMLETSTSWDNLSSDLFIALTREAIWMADVVVFLLKDLHGALLSLKFGHYNRQDRPYYCSLLFHQAIQENLVKILGYIQTLIQQSQQDTHKSTASSWMAHLEDIFSNSSLKLNDMIALLAVELPNRLAALQEDRKHLNQQIVTHFTLPRSIIDADDWKTWAKSWFDRHADAITLYQYIPTFMDLPSSMNTRIGDGGVSTTLNNDIADWAGWRHYFKQQKDQLTHLPLISTDEIRFCIRCNQPAAGLSDQHNDWPIFNDHCPCGGVWWRIPQSNTPILSNRDTSSSNTMLR
ncbi:hypothetical protein BDF19DRAFT_439496 [Syncephalis fuscata]|nr:hypothetical protein BDF19DRAFT_439496 [Syncephalis fuscata]